LPRLLIPFVANTNNELFTAWCYNRWPIATTRPKDERGHERETEVNYLDANHVPEEYHNEGVAIQYVEAFRLSVYEILNMPYSEFVKLALLHKAVTMRRPAKFISEHEYNMIQTRRKYGL
jgi:hypothetical protein